jgi:hypothetical protein
MMEVIYDKPGQPVLAAAINVNIAIAPIIANTASCAPRSGLPRKLNLFHWQSRKSMPPLRLRLGTRMSGDTGITS